jgi:uncharacterized protein YceK
MNARNTVSGTTSVLIEPWRKNSRSLRDHVGTWANSVAVVLTFVLSARDSSFEVVQDEKQKKKSRSNIPDARFGFMRGGFYGEQIHCKAARDFAHHRLPARGMFDSLATMKAALNASLGLLLVLVAGCGSIDTRWEGNRGPYVGTRFDVDQVTHYTMEGELIAAIDIPLSAVVDTLLLPYDLATEKPGTNKLQTAQAPPAETRGKNR